MLAVASFSSPLPEFTDPGFASGITEWSSNFGPPEAISWDGSFGRAAPGSLMIQSAEVSEAMLFEAASTCFGVDPNAARPIVTASVFADLGSPNERCGMLYVQYLSPDCTGERSFVGNTPQNAAGEWETRLTGGGSFSPSIRSAKLGLYLFRLAGAAGTATCHFDDLRIEGRSVVEVPSDRLTTRLLLGLSIALAGLRKVRTL